jgi:hypothetical protein
MIVDTATLLSAAVVVFAIAVATKLVSEHKQKLKKVFELEASNCTLAAPS